MKVGIVGFGSIGTEVAKALIKGVDNFSLYGIVSRSIENAQKEFYNFNMKSKFMTWKH